MLPPTSNGPLYESPSPFCFVFCKFLHLFILFLLCECRGVLPNDMYASVTLMQFNSHIPSELFYLYSHSSIRLQLLLFCPVISFYILYFISMTTFPRISFDIWLLFIFSFFHSNFTIFMYPFSSQLTYYLFNSIPPHPPSSLVSYPPSSIFLVSHSYNPRPS